MWVYRSGAYDLSHSIIIYDYSGTVSKSLFYQTEMFLWIIISLSRQYVHLPLIKKNWVNMFSSKGAQSSSVIYSLVETAKANNLRIYDYLELPLSEIPKHMSDTNLDFLQDLMPWSDKVKEKCQVLSKPQTTDQYLSL